MIVKINGSAVCGVSAVIQPLTPSQVTLPVVRESRQVAQKVETVVPYRSFEIVPHSSVKNDRVERFGEVIADSHAEYLSRIKFKGGVLRFDDPDRVFFETVITADSYRSFLTTNSFLVDMVKQHARLTWKKDVTLANEAGDPIPPLDHKLTSAYEMKLRHPAFRSLRVDNRLQQAPLSEILELSRFMVEGDIIVLQFGFQAAEDGWQKQMMKDLKNWSDAKSATTATTMKPAQSGFDFVFRILVRSDDERRRRRLSRGIILAMRQLDGDNEVMEKKVKFNVKSFIESVRKRKMPELFFGARQIVSSGEIANFIKLPQGPLQEEYPIISQVSTREVEISPKMLKGGMLLGSAKFRDKVKTVFIPCKPEDYNDMMLPSISIGGMGQGKSTKLANDCVEAVRNGFGSAVIDPAKGEIGDEIEKYLDPSQVVRFDLGKVAYALDWCEAMYDPRAKSRLASTVIGFFAEHGDDAGGQTKRFIRAAVMGMRTGKLKEIVRIFTDDKYLDETIKTFSNTQDMNLLTLKEFKGYSPAMRQKILSPIYNRLDVFLSDPHLAACMESDRSIDFVKIMSEKKAFIFDLRAEDLDKTSIDIIASLLCTKLDLAMRLRKKVTGKEDPFIFRADEPHQYKSASATWEDAAVESRKFRLQYGWGIHYWEQMPSGLQKAIKSALCHYHLYPSSEETFKSLASQFRGFTLDDFLKLQKYHAINVIRSGDAPKPFIAKMAAPPSMRRELERRSQTS